MEQVTHKLMPVWGVVALGENLGCYTSTKVYNTHYHVILGCSSQEADSLLCDFGFSCMIALFKTTLGNFDVTKGWEAMCRTAFCTIITAKRNAS